MNRVVASIRHFREDARFAARQFRRAPAYAVFTVLVLTLGIGTVTAMFTISYGVLLKPLPFRADRQLFDVVESTAKGDETFAASYPEITQWQQATTSIADVAFASNYVNIIDAPAGAEMISSVEASPNLFTLLGVEPIIGRGFMPNETISDHPNVVLLSYDTWQRSFAGDRNVLGKTVHIGATPYTVIGVMPRQFRYPLGTSVRKSGSRSSAAPWSPSPTMHRQIAEVNPHLAIGEFSTMSEAVEDSIGAEKLAAGVVGVFGGLALLITLVGLYGLLTYMVEQRTREIGIRMALGADRGAVISMVMRQALLLMVLGAAAGVCIALWSNRLLHAFLCGVTASDPWTIALAPLGLVVCGLAAAAVPARRAAGLNPVDALRAE